MKKIFFITLALLSLIQVVNAKAPSKRKADKDTESFKYEIECAGNGAQGTFLVKVWSYSKRKKVATDQCLKNAVHGVVFKGYSGANGCVPQRPLVQNAGVEAEYADFFKRFFADDGEYRRYASAGTTEIERVKISGRLKKIGLVVSVRKDELRKALEAAGVIRSLNSGF